MERISVARVVRPHGIQGEVCAEPLSDHPERYEDLTHVWIGVEEGACPREVLRCRPHGGRLLLQLEGIETLEQAEELRDRVLTIPPSEIWPLPEGEYYWHDLVGLEATDEAAKVWGQVVKVERSAASDLLVVESPEGSQGMVPFLDEFVLEVDLEARKVVLRPLPGMLEPDGREG